MRLKFDSVAETKYGPATPYDATPAGGMPHVTVRVTVTAPLLHVIVGGLNLMRWSMFCWAVVKLEAATKGVSTVGVGICTGGVG